jgi:hypothetical protein
MRKKRFTPDRSKTTFRDTQEKRDILELLAQYKYLRSSSLHTLLPKRHDIGLRKTLRVLFDEGMILKPREARRGYNNLYCPDIYMLAPKGEQYLLERGKDPLSITRIYRHEKNGPVKNFSHAMMTCDTLASIHAGANKAGVEFIPWSTIVARCDHINPMKLPCHLVHEGQVRDTWIVPDGLFGLRYPNGQVSFFVLESEHYNPIEPKTLDRASYLKKLIAYRDIHRTGVYKHQLKIPNMRVLVTAPTKTKVENMMALTLRLAGQTNLFLFHDIPVQEELMKAPPPFPELFTAEWKRAGLEPTVLFDEKKTPQ